jgi:hypothetical protein
MLLILLQGRTADTAIRYPGQGTMTITTSMQAIATRRQHHSVTAYEAIINDKNTEYVNLDRRGT